MNYEEMSDSRIAKLVAMAIESVDFNEDGDPLFAVDCFYETSGAGCFVNWSGDEEFSNFDPCNNPSDAWPIIVDNQIGINKLKCEVFWIATNCDIHVRNENPLRAAMICFLKMKENGRG